MTTRTPIKEHDQKIDIIEHINEDHQEELSAIMADYIDTPESSQPIIEDIFHEGFLISAKKDDQRETVFVPFELQGDLEEKVLYLAYKAMTKQGKVIGNTKKRYFEVISTENVTDNILRLVLKSDQPLPEKAPGFAYLFAQKTLKKSSAKVNPTSDKASPMTLWFNRALLWVLKKLSSKQRQSVLKSMNKGQRYYTLRQSEKSNTSDFSDIARVDVFLHGETQGSVWAKNLQQGDVIMSNADYEEQTQHLDHGQALLIADETALPALLSLLEQWQNPLAPVVIIITANQNEQDYLPDSSLPQDSQCYRFSSAQKNLSSAIIDCITAQTNITSAWGGLEKSLAQQVRYYFRNERHLDAQHNRIKTYWAKR